MKKIMKEIKDLSKEIDALLDRKQLLEEKMRKTWTKYITGIKPAVIKELRSLEWNTYKGRDSRGMRWAKPPAKSICLQVEELASNARSIHTYSGLYFGAFTVSFRRIGMDPKPSIVVAAGSLAAIGAKINKQKRLKSRTMEKLKDSGLSDAEIQEAVRAFKAQKAVKE